jgi:hypothetical protein
MRKNMRYGILVFEMHPLCGHLSSWDCQDGHPHPIFNHTDTAVHFTSGKDGRRAIYRVDVDARRQWAPGLPLG